MDPYQPPPPQPPPYGTPAHPPGTNPVEAVKLPAIFLIVIGAIGLLWALFSLISGLAGAEQNQAQMQQALSDPNIPPALKRMLAGASGGGAAFFNLFYVLTSGLVIFGGIQMMKLKSYGLSMAASIIAMIPCVGPCFCLGLPVGIWSLVVLNKPEVKAAFNSPTQIR